MGLSDIGPWSCGSYMQEKQLSFHNRRAPRLLPFPSEFSSRANFPHRPTMQALVQWKSALEPAVRRSAWNEPDLNMSLSLKSIHTHRLLFD